MQKFSKIILLTILLVTEVCFSALAGEYDFTGYLEVEKRFKLEEKKLPFIELYNTLWLQARAWPSERANFLGSMQVRYLDFSSVQSGQQLEEITHIDPLDIILWEALGEAILSERAVLRFGKQRIAWGSADELNPTDNLNPDDFSDPFDIGEKIPSESLWFDYSLRENLTLELAWIAALKPALLPEIPIPISLEEDPGTNIISQSERVNLPARNIKNSMYAVKLKGNIGKADLSLSYFEGYDDIPLATSISLLPVDQSQTDWKMVAELSYPRIKVLGLDLSGELFSLGYWAELGAFLPEKKKTSIIINDQVYEEKLMLEEKPYYKYTIGLDYTFSGGQYLNLQYCKGLPMERGEQLGNYLVFKTERDLLGGRITPGLEVGVEWRGKVQNNYGWVLRPAVVYHPLDNIELELASGLYNGKGRTLLALWKDWDYGLLRLKIFF